MGNPLPRSAKPGTISLKHREFRRLCAFYGLTTDLDVADVFGMDRSAVYKVRTGRALPRDRFIAGALRAFPGVSFEDLFELVDYVPRGKGKKDA